MGSFGTQSPAGGLFSYDVRRPLERRTWIRNRLNQRQFPPVPLEKRVAFLRPRVKIAYLWQHCPGLGSGGLCGFVPARQGVSSPVQPAP